jgi:DsbC/DsbD-like thiol-disulfide interchange protein
MCGRGEDIMIVMRGMTAGGAIAAAALLVCPPAQAPVSRSAVARHVTVELIAEHAELRAGTQWVGVKFTIEPGWHIYSIDPGDSGAPPEIRWHLPAGVKADPPEWPASQRIEASGLVDYGYLDSVVLPVRLTLAPGSITSPLAIQASLRWMICKDICSSGQAVVALRWPLAGEDRSLAPSWGAEIARARALVPRRR